MVEAKNNAPALAPSQEQNLANEESVHGIGKECEFGSYVLDVTVEEEINLLVEKIFSAAPCLPGAGDEDNAKKLAEVAAEGLRTTGDVMKETSKTMMGVAGIFKLIKTGAGYFGTLGSIVSAGKSAYDFYKFIRDFDKPSDLEEIKAKLEDLQKELQKIEATIQQGFADLIAHSDFIAFRDKVSSPTQSLFDDYMRCFLVSGDAPIEELKKSCESTDLRPRRILSTIYDYLTSSNNIVATHLKAKNYECATFKTWLNTIFHHAIRLVTVDLFYRGILIAETSEDKKANVEQAAKEEAKDLFGQLARLADRLNEIDFDRLKAANSAGLREKWIKETFNKMKPNIPKGNEDYPKEFLPKLANDFKEKWMEFNGSQHCYVMITRGKGHQTVMPSSDGPEGPQGPEWYRSVDCQVGDSDKVAVIHNIVGQDGQALDGLTLILIQPLTQEIFDANQDSKSIVEQIQNDLLFFTERGAYFEHVSNMISRRTEKPPLLIVYNFYNKGSISREDVKREVRVIENVYENVGEAWSNEGGPNSKKFEFSFVRQITFVYLLEHYYVQVIFQ